MKWYADVVFPTVVMMLTMDEVVQNGAEYKTAGLNGAITSVDVVHVRIWGLSHNLKQVLNIAVLKYLKNIFNAIHMHIFIHLYVYIYLFILLLTIYPLLIYMRSNV
jgi:hypothetical protein